jgi:hypothetical protein
MIAVIYMRGRGVHDYGALLPSQRRIVEGSTSIGAARSVSFCF